MADGTRRTFAQGSKGGWYVVGSERVENGRTKRDYVPEDVAMRAMQGKVTDAEIDAAVTTRPSGKKARPKKDGEVTAPRDQKPSQQQKQPAGSNQPAGRTPKQRDPRLPTRGTVIKSKDSKTYVREDAQGTFHLYDAKNNSELATGKTLTSVMVQHYGKPVNAYALLGLQHDSKKAPEPKELVVKPKPKQKPTQKQKPEHPTQQKTRAKRPRRADGERAENKPRRRSKRPLKDTYYDKREEGKGKGAAPMSPKQVSYAEHLAYKHFQRKLRGNFQRAAQSTIGIDQKGWTKLRLDVPDGRQFVVKTSPDRKQTWAKEKGPDAKPFKVTDAWVQQMQNVRASKPGRLPGTDNSKNQATSVRDTVKKALALAEQEYDVGACEVYLDGILMRGLAGDVAGFVPFVAVAGSTISADEVTKAVAEVITTKEVRVSLEPVTQALGDKPAETDDIAALYAAIVETHADETEKAVDGNTDPRKGYPRKQCDYADKDQYKYPIETESHVKAALSYFGNPQNREKYSKDKQREIARRILSAAKRFGIDVDEQSEVGKLGMPAKRD